MTQHIKFQQNKHDKSGEISGKTEYSTFSIELRKVSSFICLSMKGTTIATYQINGSASKHGECMNKFMKVGYTERYLHNRL